METDTTTRWQGQSIGLTPAADATASVQRGTTLGRYTVLEAVGSGGMGNVYAAWDPELRRRVAIKVLHSGLLLTVGNDRARDRLRGEARAAARLAHPNVVAIYDVGTVDDRLFIAMELVEGETLKSWTTQPRPWHEVVEMYRHAGRGLAAAHRAGLVHRDFKPGNVMLASDGQVKILDFGLAKAIRGDGVSATTAADSEPSPSNSPAAVDASLAAGAMSARTATQPGQVLGTPIYMSPEQQRGRPVDHRSDQFSFCVSLHQSLHGCLPTAPETPDNDSTGSVGGAGGSPSRNSGVPSRIQAVLDKGMRADPAERYPTMDDLLADLRIESTGSRRAKTAAALTVVAAIAVGAFFGFRPRAVQCETAGEHLTVVWDDARQNSLGQIFTSFGAGETWPRIASAIDDNVLALRSMYTEACEATHVRKEQSNSLLDRRVACLDDRRRSIDALLRLFEQERPEIVAKALEGVGGLASVAACADRQALSDLAPAPPTAESRAAVTAVRDRLADAFALELAGRYDEALPLTEAAVAEAKTASYRPLLGEAHLQQARVVGRLGNSEAMKASLIDAASIALATHHRALLAQAYSQLIIVGFLQGETDNAHAFGRMAASVISTLSGRDDLAAERLFFEGMIFLREGRYAEAKDLYGRYLSIPGPMAPLDEITALNNYAEALRELGELVPARQALLRAESMLDKLAPGHQMGFGILGSLGEVSLAAGDWEQAESYMLRCIAGVERSLGPDHPHLGNYLVELGRTYLEAKRFDDAVAVLERAMAIHRTKPGYWHKPVEHQWLLGRALWEQGHDRTEASKWIRQAAATVDAGEPAVIAAASDWLREHGEH